MLLLITRRSIAFAPHSTIRRYASACLLRGASRPGGARQERPRSPAQLLRPARGVLGLRRLQSERPARPAHRDSGFGRSVCGDGDGPPRLRALTMVTLALTETRSAAGRAAECGGLELRQVSKAFGSVRALDDCSFSVARGRMLGFLGPNGAGKTTTMR